MRRIPANSFMGGMRIGVGIAVPSLYFFAIRPFYTVGFTDQETTAVPHRYASVTRTGVFSGGDFRAREISGSETKVDAHAVAWFRRRESEAVVSHKLSVTMTCCFNSQYIHVFIDANIPSGMTDARRVYKMRLDVTLLRTVVFCKSAGARFYRQTVFLESGEETKRTTRLAMLRRSPAYVQDEPSDAVDRRRVLERRAHAVFD